MLTYPNPGVLPSKPAPSPDETIEIRLDGLPSFKEINRSIRNPKHPRYEAFMRLREAAITAMDGRECYSGPIRMDFSLCAPRLERRLLDYMAGIEDTLDGSHGPNFTYLPIVYQDDCQLCDGRSQFIPSSETFYIVGITFLHADAIFSDPTESA
jgi:hypothetical protein